MKKNDLSLMRMRILERDSSTCQLCKRTLPEDILQLSHVVPKSLGGENSYENFITLCPSCNAKVGSKNFNDYLAETITQNINFFDSFENTIGEIKALTKINYAEKSQKKTLNKLLFVNVISALETFLSDAFIKTVLSKKHLIKRLVESDPEFKNRRLELSEIFERMNGLENEVKTYLLEIIYHNIAKVKPMYECTLNVNFPVDLEAIFKAVLIRHDIVHRNGKTKDGKSHEISDSDISEIIGKVESFVVHINAQLHAY